MTSTRLFALAGIVVASSAHASVINDYVVFSGGGIHVGVGTTVNGRIGAYGNIDFNGATALNGNMEGKGNVALANGVTINGNITNPGSFTHGSGTTWTSRTAANPSLPALPSASVFSAGVTNFSVANGGTLNFTPGSYGTAQLGGAAHLNINGAGDYYFAGLTSGNGLNLTVNANNGLVRIFVVGQVNFGGCTVVINNGNANNFYLETAFTTTGNLNAFKSGGGTFWQGTVFAPKGDIMVGAGSGPGSVTGHLWSGTFVDIQHGMDIQDIPAPGAGLLLAASGLIATRRRRA